MGANSVEPMYIKGTDNRVLVGTIYLYNIAFWQRNYLILNPVAMWGATVLVIQTVEKNDINNDLKLTRLGNLHFDNHFEALTEGLGFSEKMSF